MTLIRKTAAAAGRSIAPTLLDRLTFTTISASDYDTIATGSSDNLSNFILLTLMGLGPPSPRSGSRLGISIGQSKLLQPATSKLLIALLQF